MFFFIFILVYVLVIVLLYCLYCFIVYKCNVYIVLAILVHQVKLNENEK